MVCPVPDPRSTLRIRRTVGEPTPWTKIAGGDTTTGLRPNVSLWVDVDDARDVLEAIPDFDASSCSFVRYSCSMCGEWQCNHGTDAETLVRREGTYVFWVGGDDGLAFDVDHYRTVLGGDPGALPPLDVPRWRGTGYDALERLRPRATREGMVPEDDQGTEYLEIHVDWDIVVPTLSFVLPPAACRMFRPLGGDEEDRKRVAAARVSDRVRAFFGGYGPLAAWVEGPAIESMFAGMKLVET